MPYRNHAATDDKIWRVAALAGWLIGSSDTFAGCLEQGMNCGAMGMLARIAPLERGLQGSKIFS